MSHRLRGASAPRRSAALRSAPIFGLFAALLLSLPIFSLTGCNIVAPIVYLVEGPPSRDAVYVLPKKRTVVFVDDRRNIIRLNARGLRQRIADTLTQELLDRKLLTDMILPRDAMGLAQSRDRHGDLMSMEEIAAGVGAEQLIYVRMTAFTDRMDGMSPNPFASAEVRIMNVVDRTWSFPDAESGEGSWPVQIIMPEIDPQLLGTTSSRLQVHQALADALAKEVAKMFYKHEIRELGGRLGPR